MSEPFSFADTTPRHALPRLFPGQAQKEFFVNESLGMLDILSHPFVEGIAASPPADPGVGDCWLVGEPAAGSFAGEGGAIACWDGSSWLFVAGREGVTVRVRGDGWRLRTATAWQAITAPPAPSGGTTVDLAARDAIATVISRLVDCGIFCP